MEFVNQQYSSGETVAAIATPPGEGGVAIVRIAGQDALHVANQVFSGDVKKFKTHTVHYGYIVNQLGERIDDVLLVPMLGKRSYTGEDTIEIHCHGGRLITRRVLEEILLAGARAAYPGEFSFKAFVNGKIDLAQAEAVQALIGAKNERALDAAEQQLQGALSKKVAHFQVELTEIAAILEAWVDFPEEGLEFASIEEIVTKLKGYKQELSHLVDTFHQGKIVHEGLSLCIVGAPNVGKSSLMNALLKKERAIVSNQPGTTRDILEDQMFLGGLHFRVLDTAGIRKTDEEVEQEGIRRTEKAMVEADLILFLFDATRPLTKEEKQRLETSPKKKTIVVWNKIDIPHTLPEKALGISAQTGAGLEALHSAIDATIWGATPPAKEEVVVTNVRHKEALSIAAVKCNALIDGLQEGISPEFLTLEMRELLVALGSILGTNITEDILSSIFSKFCIGK